jgi:hypothetical protein
MKLTQPLLATARSTGLRAAPVALLPPIPLYRRVLRANRRHLPSDMRLLGDSFVRSEFRAHRITDNPIHIVGSTLPCSGVT